MEGWRGDSVVNLLPKIRHRERIYRRSKYDMRTQDNRLLKFLIHTSFNILFFRDDNMSGLTLHFV